MCYRTAKAYQKRNLVEREQHETHAFLMRQAEQRIEAQLQVHFESIQRISDTTTLPSILLGLKSQLFGLLDFSRLTEELEHDKDNSRLNAQERIELWEKLKILSFTRATCCMWALTIAVLFVRVQFNILARHVYLDTARDISNGELSDERKALSKACHQKYILFSEFLAARGIEILKTDVEAAVINTLASKPLREPCSLADLREIFSSICLNLEQSQVDWLAYMISKEAMPQDHHDTALRDEFDDGASHDKSNTLEQLLSETRDILKSQELKDVLATSFETVLDGVMDDFESLFEDAVGGRVPLAKLLPPVSGIAVLLLEQADENRFIHAITDLQEVQAFCASVYSASGHQLEPNL